MLVMFLGGIKYLFARLILVVSHVWMLVASNVCMLNLGGVKCLDAGGRYLRRRKAGRGSANCGSAGQAQ